MSQYKYESNKSLRSEISRYTDLVITTEERIDRYPSSCAMVSDHNFIDDCNQTIKNLIAELESRGEDVSRY